MSDLLIIDVNNARRVVDWDAFKAFSPIAIAKMTQGTTFVAKSFAPHRDGAAEHGLRAFGAYHFWEPGRDPVAQADNAIRALGDLRDAPLEWLILDVETGTEFAAYEAFCKHADAALGRLTWLYGGKQLKGVMPHRPRWIARYKNHTPDPRFQPGIGEVLWQFTDKHPVPGVKPKTADCSVFRGSADDLITFIRGGRMATLDNEDLAAIDRIVRRALNEGTGVGQASWASTSKAILGQAQANHNDLATIRRLIDLLPK
ncbi:MAG: lysozyme [Frankiaceae bacterium]|nr:lysozyme [Frankiaceae bacterium]